MRGSLTRMVATVSLLALLSGFAATPAHAEDRPDVTVTAQSAHLVSPLPGHSRQWSFVVTNGGRATADLQLTITSATGSLFAGPAPALLTMTADGSTLGTLSGGEQPTRFVLPALRSGESTTIIGSLSLPAAANDAYRDAHADIAWTVEALSGPSPQVLPFTGGILNTESALVALVALLVGWLLVVVARRRREPRSEEVPS